MRSAPLLRRFVGARDGATAVEFAFVAGPFLFMMFAVIEVALVFLLSTSLDAASDKAARRIRTGEFQNANQTAADFTTALCGGMTWLANDCADSLTVDVRTYDDFASITDPLLTPSPTQPGKNSFNPGGAQFDDNAPPEKIVVVRSYYEWPLITPFLSEALARTDSSSTTAVITSTAVFRTEPYQ